MNRKKLNLTEIKLKNRINSMKSITRILSFTLLWLIVPSVVMAVDLNNY
jgi:cell division protein FtsB